MKRMFLVMAIAGAAVAPAFAQDAMMADDMTCADFTAMSADDKMHTAEMMGSGDAMMASDTIDVEALDMTCAEHPDMMLGEAMMMGE